MNLKDLKDNKAYQIMGGVIAGYIIFTVIFYFIAIAPKIGAANILKEKITEKQSFVSKAGSIEKQREKIENAKIRIDELKNDISFYEKKLPTEKDIPDLLEYLSTIAIESDVKLLEIEKKQEIRQEEMLYITVPFKLILKGGYHNIGSFVSKLENADRFMKIQELEVKEDKKNSFEHRGEMVVYTYILNSQETQKGE